MQEGDELKNRHGEDESHPSEVSPLVPPTGIAIESDEASPPSEDVRLWEELEKPWPSTFERSISLLASPMIRTAEVNLFTKSPKPGSTPAALSRRRDLRRGYYTPEATKFYRPMTPMTMSSRAEQMESPAIGRGSAQSHSSRVAEMQLEIEKFKSLDLASKKQKLLDFHDQQQKKAADAKKYREKILTKKKDEEDGLKSPGYLKEVAMRAHRQKMEEAELTLQDGKSSVSQCVFNLANILMGVGLLGLPFSLKSAGWVGGLGCLVTLGFVCWRTAILIGRELNGDPRPSHVFVDSPFKSPLQPGSVPEARMLPPIRSFPDIARAAFGEVGCFILSIILYFELFSCICIFFVAIGDHLHQLFPDIPASTHVMVVGGISMVPTIILRTPALLSYLSMVGTFATIAVVLSVGASALATGDISEQVAQEFHLKNAPPFHILFDSSGVALAFGLVAYCFSGHAIVPSIYTSMRQPQKFETMVTYTFFIVVCACVGVAVSGYYMFGSTVLDQVTLSLERSVKAGNAMVVLTWLMVMTAFSKVTLTLFPLAIGMEELVAPYLTSDRMVQVASASIKFILTGLALFVAVCIPSFSFLCSIVGMICTMSVSVILPAAAHYKLFGSKIAWWEKLLDFIFIGIGLFLAVAGTIATL